MRLASSSSRSQASGSSKAGSTARARLARQAKATPNWMRNNTHLSWADELALSGSGLLRKIAKQRALEVCSCFQKTSQFFGAMKPLSKKLNRSSFENDG